jgi:hypothetical protein
MTAEIRLELTPEIVGQLALTVDTVLNLQPLKAFSRSRWVQVVGVDGSVARERRLDSRDAGPDWTQTEFEDGFGQEISRELPGTEGQPDWTETFDPESEQITRSRFDAAGNYFRESMLHGEAIVVRSRSLGLATVTQDVTGKLRGLPSLPLKASRPPRLP